MHIRELSGVGDKHAALLGKHGLETVESLLTYYPRSYRTYRATTIDHAQIGDWVSLVGTVSRPLSRHTARVSTQLATFRETPERSGLTLRWFNSPYLTRSLDPGATYLVRGQLTVFGATRQLVAPQLTKVDHTYLAHDEILPVYTAIGSLKSGHLRNLVKSALKTGVTPPDPLSLEIRNKFHLLDLSSALNFIHFPPGHAELEAAIHRLGFAELYALQIEALRQNELSRVKTEPLNYDPSAINNFLGSLPFTPTSAQTKVIHEILADLHKPHAMRRLLSGDVGSGKTLVAASAALACHLSGRQTLVMAPTQILAEQLSGALAGLLGPAVTVSLITATSVGKTDADIVVGTQALLSPKHKFARVGLVIVDEQHRFGVKQREYLSSLSPAPHTLMMTATPIPRTLAMTIFAGLSISRLDEMPKNRLPVKTYLVPEVKRASAYAWIEHQIKTAGEQAFVVTPVIEEAQDNEGNPQHSLKLLEATLKSRFPGLKIDILHGKLKNQAKTASLNSFRLGETQILVATSMIEVGIDIPQVNLMVIEDAERFGLAQLHQLRGRVGRGGGEGHCLLFTRSRTDKALERLTYFKNEKIGEKLAAYDLKTRGPGELFGLSQHGFFSLRFASIYDSTLLQDTYEAVKMRSI